MFERTPAAAVSHESSTHETFAARTASPPLVGLPGHGRASEAHFSGESQVCLPVDVFFYFPSSQYFC